MPGSEQLSLFDDNGRASSVDRDKAGPASGITPESIATSAAAGAAILPKSGTLRRRVYDFIASRGDRGATDEEMQDVLEMGANTQRPRRVELLRDGLIRQSQEKRETKSGKLAVVWKTTRS